MNVQPGIWETLSKVTVCLFVVALILLAAQRYVPLIQQNERMRKKVLDLKAEKQKEAELARQQKAMFEALRYDPQTVERLARARLGYVKPGEKMVIFEAQATNSQSSAAGQ